MADKKTDDADKVQKFKHADNGTVVTAPASMAEILAKQGFKPTGQAKPAEQ